MQPLFRFDNIERLDAIHFLQWECLLCLGLRCVRDAPCDKEIGEPLVDCGRVCVRVRALKVSDHGSQFVIVGDRRVCAALRLLLRYVVHCRRCLLSLALLLRVPLLLLRVLLLLLRALLLHVLLLLLLRVLLLLLRVLLLLLRVLLLLLLLRVLLLLLLRVVRLRVRLLVNVRLRVLLLVVLGVLRPVMGLLCVLPLRVLLLLLRLWLCTLLLLLLGVLLHGVCVLVALCTGQCRAAAGVLIRIACDGTHGLLRFGCHDCVSCCCCLTVVKEFDDVRDARAEGRQLGDTRRDDE